MATKALTQKPTEIKSVKAEIPDEEIINILDEQPAEQTAASTENLNEKVTEVKADKSTELSTITASESQKPDTQHFKEVLLDSTKFKSTYQKIGKYYCCKLCINSQKFPRFFALQQHLKFQHFIRNSTPNENETESEEEESTNDNITASNINYAEAVKKIAAKHYECTMCSESKSFTSNLGVQRHIREQHYGQDSYQCTLCDISTEYKSSQALQIHIRIQHNGYRYVCSFCDTSYKSKTAIYSHLKRSHKNADHADDVGDASAYRFEIPKTCKPAEQFYLNYAEFIKQAEDSSYQCALCPENTKKYTTMQAVRIHIKILHFGIRLQCSKCSCKFRSKQSIIKHLKATHNIIKRASDIFQIEMPTNKKIEELRANCAAAEEDAANLIRKKEARRDHIRRQNLDMLKTTEVCPSLRLNYMKSIRKVDDHYECVHCEVSRKYYCRSGLRVHIKISHYGYRYVCNECNVNYKTKLIILRHLKKTHNINGNAFKMEIPKKSGKTKSSKSNYAETEDFLLEKLHEEQKTKFLRHDEAATGNNTLFGLIKTEQISDEINAELDKASSTSVSYQQRLKYSSASPESRALLKLQQVKNHPRQRFAEAVKKSSTSKKQQLYLANASTSLESKNSSKQHQQPYQSKISQRLDYEAATSKFLAALQSHEKEENSSFQSKFIKQEEISFGEYSMSYASKSKLKYKSSKIIFKYSTSYKKMGKSYRCKLCAKSQRRFFQFSAIRQHIKFQHFTIRFQCTQCSEQLAHPALLRKHYTQQHATNGPFKLKINLLKKPRNLTNPKKTNNAAKQNVKINYKNLIKQIDTGRYECRLCPKSISYTTPHGICNHIRNQHYGYKHLCQKCNVHFITKEALQKHLRQMHFKLIKKSGEFFECGKCWTPKKYKNINTLQNHIQTEHYGYRYVCGECSSQCMSKTALQRHLKQAHGMQVKSAELKCELPENKNSKNKGDNKEELTINSSATAENSINVASQLFEHSQHLEFTNKFIKQEQIDLSEYSLSYDNAVAASACFVTPKTEHSSSSTSFGVKFLDEDVTTASLQQPEQHVSNSSFQFAGSIRQQLELSHDVINQEQIEFKEYSLSNPKPILFTSKAEPGSSTLTSCHHQHGSNPEASLKLLGQQMEFTPESIKQEENSFSEYFLSCNTSGEAKPNPIIIATKAEHVLNNMTTGH